MKRIVVFYTLGVFVALGFYTKSAPAAQKIIAHANAPSSLLSKRALRAIFQMRMRQWPNGKPIAVFVLRSNHPVHVTFCKIQLGLFPYQLQSLWDRMVFSGTGLAPVVVDDQQQMIEKIRQTPGSIGYVSEEWPHEDIKTITIQ